MHRHHRTITVIIVSAFELMVGTHTVKFRSMMPKLVIRYVTGNQQVIIEVFATSYDF